MRIYQRFTNTQVGFVFTLLFGALGVVGLGFQLSGYQNTNLANVFYGLAAVCVIGAIVAFFWSWIKEAWSRLRRDTELQQLNAQLETTEQDREELKQENEDLVAEVEALKKQEPDVGEEFFVPQREIGGVRGSRYYKGEVIYFPDIVRELATQIRKGKGVILVELTFEGCQIHGPAMVKPVQGNLGGPFFVRCEWEEDLDAFYLKDPEREATGSIGKETGVVGLLDCVFRDCYFRGVGVVTNRETYEAAKEQYKSPGDDLISL